MMHPVRKGGAVLLLSLVSLWLRPASAEIFLWELSPGAANSNNAQYVVLGLLDEANLDGMSVRTQLSDGTRGPLFAELSGAPPDPTGFLVIGTAAMARFYEVEPDELVSGANLPTLSGRVCLFLEETAVDCVAYGQFTGENASFGVPVQGVQPGQALTRVAFTGNNFTDWVVSFPAPGRFLQPGVSPEVQPPPAVPPAQADGGVFDGGVVILPPGFNPDAGVVILPPGFNPDAGVVILPPGFQVDAGMETGGGGGVGEPGGRPPGQPEPGETSGGQLPQIPLGPQGGDELPDQSVGCACSSGGAGGLAVLALAALGGVLMRRRRRRA